MLRRLEIVTSAFKRAFGESVGALLPHTTYIEIDTKMECSSTTTLRMSETGRSGHHCAATRHCAAQPRRAALRATPKTRIMPSNDAADAPLTRFGLRTRANHVTAAMRTGLSDHDNEPRGDAIEL